MIPPAVKSGFLRSTFLYAAVMLVILAGMTGFLGPTVRASSMVWAILIPTVCICAGLLYQRPIRRLQKLLKQHPEGLCVKCEYPLPASGQDPVTCAECGLTRTRQEHRDDWKRWVTG